MRPDKPEGEEQGHAVGGNGNGAVGLPAKGGGPTGSPAKKKSKGKSGFASGKHPNSVKHQFPPGVSGNPAGQPVGTPHLSKKTIREVGALMADAMSGKIKESQLPPLLRDFVRKVVRSEANRGILLHEMYEDMAHKAGLNIYNGNTQVTGNFEETLARIRAERDLGRGGPGPLNGEEER